LYDILYKQRDKTSSISNSYGRRIHLNVALN
jgi:hypothetical protein